MVATASTLALLNEELEQVRRDREALRTKNPGATMPESARAEDEDLVRRAGRITSAIEVEKQKMRDASMDETARYMDDPSLQVRHPVNDDHAGRKTLEQAGWNIRGGTVFRNTTRGEFAYCPEAVLFGAVPSDDPVAAKHVKTMRATFQPEYRAAFIKWFRNRGNMNSLTGAEQNALSEGVAAEGGFTVPADWSSEILVRKADTSVMRRLARVVQTSRDRIQFPAVVPNASSGSIYSSAFVGGLVGERPVNTDVGPTFQQFEIGIKKFEVYTKLTNDLIEDSASDLLGFLARDGGENLALVEDNYFINGLGTGLEPLGLLNAGLTTADVEGSTANNVSNSTTDAGSAPKIVSLSYLVPAQYAERSSWLMARQTMGEIHGLVDGDGRPWWQQSAVAGGELGAPRSLLGFPVFTSPFMPVDNTNANKVMVVGDFSAYIIADRSGVTVQIDPINHIGTDETAIYIRSRAGGGLWNTDALRVGIV